MRTRRPLFLNIFTCFVNLSHAAHPDSSAFTAEDGRGVPGPRCDCYTISGPDPAYFSHYRFWDFRAVPLRPEVARNFNFHPSIDADKDSLEEFKSTNFDEEPVLLKDTPFAVDWEIQDWHRNGTRLFPVTIVNSDKNVFISKSKRKRNSTFLTLRNTRLDSFSSTAEIETAFKDVFHVSMRVRLRLLDKDEPMLVPPVEEAALVHTNAMVIAGPDTIDLNRRNARRFPPPNGACAGIFTYHSRTSESDIEILTADPPNRVHYANQPDWDPVTDRIIPGASEAKNVPIPWTSWSTHRLDWLPHISRWYVENELQATNTYGVPQDPSMLIINIWSDGGIWSGNLTVGESVHLGIEWIEIAYNVSSGQEDNTGTFRGRENNEMHILFDDQQVLSHISEDDSTRFLTDSKWKRYADGDKQCKNVCRIDDVKDDGIPELVQVVDEELD